MEIVAEVWSQVGAQRTRTARPAAKPGDCACMKGSHSPTPPERVGRLLTTPDEWLKLTNAGSSPTASVFYAYRVSWIGVVEGASAPGRRRTLDDLQREPLVA